MVTRQYPENDFISVYSRGDWEGKIDRKVIHENNERFLRLIGALPNRAYIWAVRKALGWDKVEV